MISQNSGKANKNKMLWYNDPYFKVCKLTYFLIRLIYHRETQSKRFKNPFYRQQFDSLWWLISPPEIFSKDQSPHSSQSTSSAFAEEQSVQHRRGNISVSLSDDFGSWSDRDVSSPQTQWRVSISNGTSGLSESNHFTSFSFTDGAIGSQPPTEVSRQDAFADDPETGVAQKGYLRFRFDRLDSLWETGAGRDRIQSHEEGPAVLPSFAVFQRHHQRFLAGRTASGRFPYINGSFRTSQGLLFETALVGKSQNYQGRQGFLRSSDDRISGIRDGSFRDRSQDDEAHKKEVSVSFLQDLYFRDRDLRVHVPTDQMEKSVSFYRHSAADSRGTIGAAQSFFNGQIQLPGHRDESKDQSAECLEVLQCAGGHGADY